MEKLRLASGIWNVIPDGMSSAYLIIGGERALLIDSGAGERDVKARCLALCDKPIDVVNTHYHADHMGANGGFENIYMHPNDIARLSSPDGIKPVGEGDVFELGGRSVRVIETPGHTFGSISLVDGDTGFIFTGDMVCRMPIFLCSGDYDLDLFKRSLERLLAMNAPMYSAHDGDNEPNGAGTLTALLETIELYRAGKIEPRETEAPMYGTAYISENGTGFFVPGAK